MNCEFIPWGSVCLSHIVSGMLTLFMVFVFGTARSVLVLNGNGADLAKHAIPAVPSER